MRSLGDQLRRHSVALISPIVALTALAYNTWRNEETEENRNIRTAGIELLLKLGELEQVVFLSHYDADAVRGSSRHERAAALLQRDLLHDSWRCLQAGRSKEPLDLVHEVRPGRFVVQQDVVAAVQ